MQETRGKEVRNWNVVKASPSDHSAGNEGRKIGWTRILRHLFPHKVRWLLVEHDALEEMRSELQRLRAQGDVTAKAVWLQSDFMERTLLHEGQRPPLNLVAKIRSVFQRNTSNSSAVDVALAACSLETERISGLYESLAMRVANLEADLQTQTRQGPSRQMEHTKHMATKLKSESQLPNQSVQPTSY
jgi:hypothetical protein